MLQIYNLSKSLDDTKKELAHALYQYDAACRVISQLIKDKDSSARELKLAKDELNACRVKIECF